MSNWWAWYRWRKRNVQRRWTVWHIKGPSGRKTFCGIPIGTEDQQHISPGSSAPPEARRCKRCTAGLRPDTMTTDAITGETR